MAVVFQLFDKMTCSKCEKQAFLTEKLQWNRTCIKAAYDNGILVLALPKTEVKKALHTVEIQ